VNLIVYLPEVNMFPPIFYALGLAVGLVSYYIQQRASDSRYRIEPYIPQPDRRFSDRPLYQFQALNPKAALEYDLTAKTIIDGAMMEGDKRALYDLPELLHKKANKIQLSNAESARLDRYIDTINTYYTPKMHEAITPLKNYVKEEDMEKIPDNTIMGQFVTQFQLQGGPVEMYCEGKTRKDLLLLTCETSTNYDKVFRFIQDTRLQNDAYFKRSDDKALSERMEHLATNGWKVNEVFYPEYLVVAGINPIFGNKI
jgi:hypothetical protein